MGSLNAVKINSLKAIKLSQLQKQLRPVSGTLQFRKGALAEASEQQTVTGEILRVIAKWPIDIQLVLDPETDRLAQTFRQSTNRTCEMIK